MTVLAHITTVTGAIPLYPHPTKKVEIHSWSFENEHGCRSQRAHFVWVSWTFFLSSFLLLLPSWKCCSGRGKRKRRKGKKEWERKQDEKKMEQIKKKVISMVRCHHHRRQPSPSTTIPPPPHIQGEKGLEKWKKNYFFLFLEHKTKLFVCCMHTRSGYKVW